MLGYLDAPDQTAARYRGEWFLTGDQAQMDADGQITYLGRNDDMMNAGGFRVSPLEVEAALAGAPGITGIGVAEVTVKEGVSVIAAFYTAPAPLDDQTLDAYAKDKLARLQTAASLSTCARAADGREWQTAAPGAAGRL